MSLPMEKARGLLVLSLALSLGIEGGSPGASRKDGRRSA